MSQLRPVLGDFSSIVCFKALVVGVEETLGQQAAAVALKSAGRKRGKALASSLGLTGTSLPLEDVTATMRKALGDEGTRLCQVDSITREGESYLVRLSDTVCSAGEPAGSSRELTFTLGAIHGAMEALLSTKLRAKQTASVLRGGTHDTIELQPV